MKHRSSTLQGIDKVVGNDLLKAIQQAVATVGKQVEPTTFAHVQPHAHATAKLIRYFATACGFGNGIRGPTLDEIEFGAYMHDIGKYFIAPSILLKPGKLDEDERAVMSLHPVYGAIAISKIPGITASIRRGIFYHHEHWDGSGYPDGLSGTVIPLEARIVSVVDVYTSLRSRRSYKLALTKQEALKTLVEMAGYELDPYIVEDFVKLLGNK